MQDFSHSSPRALFFDTRSIVSSRRLSRVVGKSLGLHLDVVTGTAPPCSIGVGAPTLRRWRIFVGKRHVVGENRPDFSVDFSFDSQPVRSVRDQNHAG